MGFRVWGLGFEVWDLRFWDQGLESGVLGFGLRIKVWDAGFRV